MKKLFVGELDAGALAPFPFLDAERKELLDMLREALGRFAADRIDAAAIDREHKVPAEVIEGLAELGLFGMRVPEEHGGLALDDSQYVRVGVDLARYDGPVAILSGGHSTIGIKALLLYGSDEQKARYLPRLATGELKAAFALSEPGAGSDAQSLRCTAKRDANGDYVLDGEKLWITNGGFADLVTVFARTPDHPRTDGRPSISCFLVERAMGFVSGKEEEKLGIRGSSTVPLLFEGVRVPAANLVGEPGDGFRIALEVLNTGRCGLAGNCLGAGRYLLEQTASYTSQRAQFGRPIGEFELVQEKLARMAQDLHALDCMVFLTTGLMDRGLHDHALEAALCKVFGTETLWSVVNDAVQCAGGNGFTTDYPFERMLRDARVNMIFEGTNEILRVMVATTGLRDVARRLADGVGEQSDYGRIVHGKETALPIDVPAALSHDALALSMGVSDLARSAAKAVAEHGKAVRDRQLVCAALSDQAMALWGQLAVLLRAASVVAAEGEDAAADELLLAKGACRRLARRARTSVQSLRDNDDEVLLETAVAVLRWGGLPGERA
ncbi:MAG: acyl-CoA dehydrogenase family protein [Planctomycetes bacterium]|nr:acyl-CoA dehydrogenase family protein [Planctomycetota bacterium]